MRANQISSAVCKAERTIRVIRSGVGGSMNSARQCFSSSSRTRSALRSACATLAASHLVSFSASCTEHTRNPRCSRIWARWYSIVLPVHG